MTSPVSQFSAHLVKMSRMSTAIGVCQVKNCQPGASANYQVISVVQPPPIILTKKTEAAEENIVEQKVETVTSIVAALPPLPTKRWEMQPAVKIPSVNISITDSTQT